MQHKEADDYVMESALEVSLLPYSWPFHFVTLNVQYTAGEGEQDDICASLFKILA
jgi:hypothetical protein